MRPQLLRDRVLVDRAEVHTRLVVQYPQLDSLRVLAGKEAHVVGEELEQVPQLRKLQREDRGLHVVGRQCHARLPEPDEAVLVAVELEVLVQLLEDEALVLSVQFRRDKVEDVFYIQLALRVVLADVLLVQAQDGLLHGDDIPDVVRVQVGLHCGWHSSHNQIEPEQLHQLGVDGIVNWGP